jgi:hypothetical protein
MVAGLFWPTIIFTVCAVNLSTQAVSSYIDDDNPAFARLPIYPLILEGKFEQKIEFEKVKNFTKIKEMA